MDESDAYKRMREAIMDASKAEIDLDYYETFYPDSDNSRLEKNLEESVNKLMLSVMDYQYWKSM